MGNKSNDCPKCGKSYVLSSSLKTHLLSHINDITFQCSKCHATFPDEDLLEQHISDSTCDGTHVDETLSHLHDIRGFTPRNYSKGKNGALKQLKVYRRRFKCTECPRNFFEKAELRDHMLSHENNTISTPPQEEQHDIEKTGSVVRSSGCHDIKRDARTSKTFNKGFLKSPSSIRDTHQLVICPVCRRTFLVDDDLKTHMECHTDANESRISVVLKAAVADNTKIQSCKKTFAFSSFPIDFELQPGDQEGISCPESFEIDPSEEKLRKNISHSPNVRVRSHETRSYTIRLSSNQTDVDLLPSDKDTEGLSHNRNNQNGFNTLFKCPNCPVTFFTRAEIERHLKNHGFKTSEKTVEEETKGDLRASETTVEEETKGDLRASETTVEEETKGNPRASETTVEEETKGDLRASETTVEEEPKGDLRASETTVEEETKGDLRASETTVEEETNGDLLKGGSQETFYILYKCEHCPLIFLEKKEAENHILIHNNVDTDNQFESRKNGLSSVCASSNILSEIVTSVSDYTITVYRSHECPVCTTFFSDEAEMEQHILSSHKDCNSITPTKLEVCHVEIFGQRIVVSNTKVIEDESNFNVIKNGTTWETDMTSSIPKLTTPHGLGKPKVETRTEEKVHKCSVCGKEFEDEKKLINHRRIHEVRKHICKVCGKSFRANSYLRVHMSVHIDTRPHICTKCNKSFKSVTALKLHETVHLNARPFQCSVCNANFKLKNSLTLHKLVHSNDRPFNCERCKKTFKSSLALKIHMKIHNDKSEKKLFYCSQCCKTYSSEKNYKCHMRLHSGDAPHKCQYCGKGFFVKPFLTQHLRTHTGERPFKCPMCEKRFAVKSTLRNHMDTHSDVKRYVCHICGVHITQQQTLSSHLKKHSGEKQHKCSLCGKEFFLKSNIRRHMRIHNEERPYKCLLCSKTFKQNAHLKNHMASHKGEKPHRCNACNKCFTYKSSLRNHMISHSVDRPFTCNKCGKSFRSRASLKVHLLIHNTEERFTCPECGKKFKLEKSLNVHLRKKSKAVSFTCQMCKKVFTRRACLYQHKKSHLMETDTKETDDPQEVHKTPVKICEELESIKVAEVLDDFDGHEAIQVHIIV